MLTALGAASCAYPPSAPPPEGEPPIAMCRDRTIWTKPFAHSVVSVRDAESIVHVPGDDNLWLGDDASATAYEFDRRTGQFRSRVSAREIIEAFPEAGICDDGDGDPETNCSYIGELEVVAYDPASHTLYLFNTIGSLAADPPVDKPAVFRLQKKGGHGRYRFLDWWELPAGRKYGPAVVAEGKLYLAIGADVVEYDFEWNCLADTDDLGNPRPLLSVGPEENIVGMAFDGSSLWILTNGEKLVQVDWSSKAVVASHDLTPFGISRVKGLAYGAGEFFIVEGEDPNLIHVLRFGTPKKRAWWRGGLPLSCG